MQAAVGLKQQPIRFDPIQDDATSIGVQPRLRRHDLVRIFNDDSLARTRRVRKSPLRVHLPGPGQQVLRGGRVLQVDRFLVGLSKRAHAYDREYGRQRGHLYDMNARLMIHLDAGQSDGL
jgi:hypothetical protein